MIPPSMYQLSRQALANQHALNQIMRDRDAALEQSQVYIGLNDSETREQKFETEQYVAVLKEVCREFGVPFSFDVVEGGYIHDDGEYTEEKTIVLTFIDVPTETVDDIAKKVRVLFHQESVLVTADLIKMRFIREEL